MELIKVTEKEGKQLVSARELHNYLEVKSEFSHWFKLMVGYGFEEGQDFTSFLTKSNGGRPSKQFAISLDMAKEISMLQRSEKGKVARKYFIECEKKLKNQFTIPETFHEALQLAANQAKEIEKLKVKEKVADRLLLSNIAITIGEFAKCYCNDQFNIGQNRLFTILRDRKHLMNNPSHPKHNTPYQKYIDSGYYTVIQKPYKRANKDNYALQTMVTPKGQEWLLKNLDKYLNS